MRGGQLRIFLLCHLELEARSLALECQFNLSIESRSSWFVHYLREKCASRWDHLSHCPCSCAWVLLFVFVFGCVMICQRVISVHLPVCSLLIGI